MRGKKYILEIIAGACIVVGCNKSIEIQETELLTSSVLEEEDNRGEDELYAQFFVKKGNGEITTLSVSREECGNILPEVSEMFREEDVDFDGKYDVLIYLGEFGEKQKKRYKCYLSRESGLSYCRGFELIDNPEVISSYHLLCSSESKNEEKFILNRYEIEKNVVQKIDSVEVGNTHRFYDGIFCDLIFNRKQNDLRSAYQYIVNSYEKSGFSCQYDLIYFNDDKIPELVIEISDSAVSMYTFYQGEIRILLHEWAYGASGNYGYQYIERGNVLQNVNTDYAGAVKNYSYFEIVDGNEFAVKYFLKESYEDEDGNVIMDDFEEGKGKWNYYYNVADSDYIPVTKEEFDVYKINGEYISLIGKYEKDEVLKKIEKIATLETTQKLKNGVTTLLGGNILRK